MGSFDVGFIVDYSDIDYEHDAVLLSQVEILWWYTCANLHG
jgi:hypothetical protein